MDIGEIVQFSKKLLHIKEEISSSQVLSLNISQNHDSNNSYDQIDINNAGETIFSGQIPFTEKAADMDAVSELYSQIHRLLNQYSSEKPVICDNIDYFNQFYSNKTEKIYFSESETKIPKFRIA